MVVTPKRRQRLRTLTWRSSQGDPAMTKREFPIRALDCGAVALYNHVAAGTRPSCHPGFMGTCYHRQREHKFIDSRGGEVMKVRILAAAAFLGLSAILSACDT